MSKFTKGDRVSWRYRHHFNSSSSAIRFKDGTVNNAHKEGGMLTGLYKVKFDGNKTLSLVQGSDLQLLDFKPSSGNSEAQNIATLNTDRSKNNGNQ